MSGFNAQLDLMEVEDDEVEEVHDSSQKGKTKDNRRSSVWNYFKTSENSSKAICSICKPLGASFTVSVTK
jgi:hypothetical protein